jgi:hypothetical protein
VSALFFVSGALCFALASRASRKLLSATLFAALATFAASIVASNASARNVGYAFSSIMSEYRGQTGLEDMQRSFWHDSNGRLYYPFMPFFPLVVMVSTPVLPVVVASFFVIFFCLGSLLTFQGERNIDGIKEQKSSQGTDVPLLLAGLGLAALGLGVLVSVFVLSNVTLHQNGGWNAHNSRLQLYLVTLSFLFAAMTAIACAGSGYRGRLLKSALFLQVSF